MRGCPGPARLVSQLTSTLRIRSDCGRLKILVRFLTIFGLWVGVTIWREGEGEGGRERE